MAKAPAPPAGLPLIDPTSHVYDIGDTMDLSGVSWTVIGLSQQTRSIGPGEAEVLWSYLLQPTQHLDVAGPDAYRATWTREDQISGAATNLRDARGHELRAGRNG